MALKRGKWDCLTNVGKVNSYQLNEGRWHIHIGDMIDAALNVKETLEKMGAGEKDAGDAEAEIRKALELLNEAFPGEEHAASLKREMRRIISEIEGMATLDEDGKKAMVSRLMQDGEKIVETATQLAGILEKGLVVVTTSDGSRVAVVKDGAGIVIRSSDPKKVAEGAAVSGDNTEETIRMSSSLSGNILLEGANFYRLLKLHLKRVIALSLYRKSPVNFIIGRNGKMTSYGRGILRTMELSAGDGPVFSFTGMQRSGNHAIIMWFGKHFCACEHFNNIEGEDFYKVRKKYYYGGKAPGDMSMADKMAKGRTASIFSWENVHPSKIMPHPQSNPIITVMRDPYNWWASWYKFSRFRRRGVRGMNRNETIELYIEFARTVMKEKEHNFINFNRWFKDLHYRRQIEDRYGLVNSDEGIDAIPRFGKGSSFDEYYYENRAREMAVLSRWEVVKDDPDYKGPLRKYPEIADISRQLFNFEPPKGL